MGNKRESLEPQLLQLGSNPEEDVLLGSKCDQCGRYFVPQRKWCGFCAQPTTRKVEMSRQGVLTSFSLMTRKPEYALVDTPYVLGEVTLPEGVIVYSVINVDDPEDLVMGQAVRLHTVAIKKNDSGEPVMAYTFQPVP